jgi:DNA-binding PadR family transcriptional regulator
LFPEKGTYESGNRPKSGICKIESTGSKKEIAISLTWVTPEHQAFASAYTLPADGEEHPFVDKELADTVLVKFTDALNFEIVFKRNHQVVLTVLHELQPNGYLKIIQQGNKADGNAYTNTEVYHKQLRVIPYSTSVSGAAIKATEQGVIRHKALTAMEEQTNMQLEQIRKQIELLAMQAREIQMRKELSIIIYNVKLSLVPVIGHAYFLYEKNDSSCTLSLISPKEYGGTAGPYKSFIAPVKLLADHTWVEV